MIELRNVTKSFGEEMVLNNISTTYEPGKTNLVIGRSGSGKSVLMKCEVGLMKVDSGEILYNDRSFQSMTPKEQKGVRMEIGMLFQGNALFDSMTVEENIRFPLDMFSSMTKGEKQKRVDFCLERVSLKGSNDKAPSEISGGMKKRVALARAIVLQPKYLFCDEPNSGLDPKTAIIIDELIREITIDQNITTVVNTHDMNSVMNIGDKVIFLHQGKKHWEGSNKEILHTDNPELYDFVFASEFLKRLKEDNT